MKFNSLINSYLKEDSRKERLKAIDSSVLNKEQCISIWRWERGEEKCFLKYFGHWEEGIFELLYDRADTQYTKLILRDLKFKDFEVDQSGEGWTMYTMDKDASVGIFVVEFGFDWEECKREQEDQI